MANTTIQLKYSDVTSAPASLATAEVAYSNNSNKLYIGQSDGSVVAIGGKYYTGLVDAATSANTASAIVKRDADGNFTAATITANLSGNATTATTWRTARTLGLSGDATGTISVDGSSNQNISVVLANTAVTAGTYGGATQIPTFAVDSKGRLTSAGNVAVATGASFLNAAADTGTANIALSSDTFTITGRDGISTLAVDANNTVLIDVDNTVLRTTGSWTIDGSLGIAGNLTVAGTYVTQDVNNVSTEDPLIQLAANNNANIVDIGLFGQANTGASTIYTALFRDATDGKYKLLTDGTELPTSTVNVTAFSTATLVANLESTSITNVGSSNLLIGPSGKQTTIVGATGVITPYGAIVGGNYSGNQIDVSSVGFGTQIKGVYEGVDIRVSTDGSGANVSSFNPNGTVTLFGKVTAAGINLNDYTQAAFDKANTSNTTADAAFAKANSANVLAQAAFNQANTDFTNISTTAGTYGDASIVPVFTLAANGRVSSVTNTTIAIGASAITSGTLGVARGGTGFSSYTANGVIFGGLTSTSPLLSVASSTEGHVLQISSSGIPTFAHLSGGSF
jgi:hypothetical protein